jgi:hypothetical protein
MPSRFNPKPDHEQGGIDCKGVFSCIRLIACYKRAVKMSFPLLRRLALMASLLALSLVVACGSQVTFSDTWKGVSATYYGDGYYTINTYGSAIAYISVPLTNVDISQFNTNTPIFFGIGTVGSTATIYSGSLGDDKGYSAGKRAVVLKGGVTVSWSATTLDVSLSAGTDVLQEETTYADNSDTIAADNTEAIGGAYEVTVQLGDFVYDNQDVVVTGHNTETEYFPPAGTFVIPGTIYPLAMETGWVHGSADFSRPVVSILSPAADLTKVYDGGTLIHMKGRASDNIDLASVEYIINGDTNNPIAIDQAGELPTNHLTWTASFDLSTNSDAQVGSNVVTVVAVDTSGNQTSASWTILWIETNSAALTINPTGAGTVRGLRNGQELQKGFSYPVTAIPFSKKWIFAGWTDGDGDFLSFDASYNYVDTDGTLTANFAPNPFNAGLAGTYTGLFFNTNNWAGAQPTNSGYITIKVTESGAYSGLLYLADNARPFSLSGQLAVVVAGTTATNHCLVKVNKSEILDVSLQVAADTNLSDSGAGTVAGFVGAYSDGAMANQIWSAPIQGQLSLYTTNIAAGVYNVIISPASLGNPFAGPGGYSYGTATVTKKGDVAWMMNLADGTSPPISFSTALGQNGDCPFYASLYSGKGVVIGWVQFGLGSTGEIQSSAISWTKLPAADKFYTNGFSSSPVIAGALYFPPRAGTNIFAWTNAPLSIGPEDSTDDLADFDLTFDPAKNILSAPGVSTKELALTFSKSSGMATGTYLAPGTKIAHPFRSLETAGYAWGFYLTTNDATSTILIGPVTAPDDGGSGDGQAATLLLQHTQYGANQPPLPPSLSQLIGSNPNPTSGGPPPIP